MKVNKQNKLLYYIKGYSRNFDIQRRLDKELNDLYRSLANDDLVDIEFRVDYYNQLSTKTKVNRTGKLVKDLTKPKNPKAYYFDTYEYARYFDESLLIDYAFGDINTCLPIPMITKSRPIQTGNVNNILLNLDKARHFVTVEDTIPYKDKKDLLIGRCAVYQQHRYAFFEKYFESTLCNLGQVNTHGGNPAWRKPKISIPEHLKYKFILSLEGNDVATNLKWIMSSNSVAVAPRPKIESWYMEGTLLPDVHYIEVSDDYSNLEEKIHYFIANPKQAEEISCSANNYRKKFLNHKKEKLISLLVLKKYFEYVS